ncbi:protein kinase [Micromonospora sp. WMMD882]|uniref:protein kinase domain-containing protein n=1 Tax=Micromonospora sp. WMMD882 TaxID=3015151 RepID=UPI00248B6C0B|nr:protein kinase [Micromonospora sp. WMMD882]WBB80618.1 protein kinase [Micromonospora sp. WMMD882]
MSEEPSAPPYADRRPGDPEPPPTRREDVPADLAADPPPTRREDPAGPPTTRREPTGADAGAADPHGWAADGLLRLPTPLRAHWRIVRDLPGGGEADLVLVRDTAGDQRVVKIYRRHVTVDREVAARLVTLDRTHLVAPERTGHDDGRHWELMEYVPGGSLADHLDTATLPTPEIVAVVGQISAALAELHRARLTHSDLKPSNVLLRSTAPVRLALSDFGLSKYLGEASKRFTRRAHTIAYAAPESFSGRFSPAQDWWALGIIVRQLATGEAPFAGLAERVALHELLVRDVPLAGVTDERLRLLCQGLLVRDPDHRWGVEQVDAWLAGQSPPVHHAAGGRARRPLTVAGRDCWTRTDLARAFAAHWDHAQRTFLERVGTPGDPGEGWRLLRSWLEQFDTDVEQRILLIDQVLTADLPPGLRMAHLLRWLDPTLPPTYRGTSLLPEHVAGLAATAESGPGPAAEIVDELWRHQLADLLAGFAGGEPLREIDRRWRTGLTSLDTLRAHPALPAPARQALARAGRTHLAALLRAAADPDVAPALAARAAAARDRVPDRPAWFAALPDGADPAAALVVLTVAGEAEAEAARARAERDRGRALWEQEEAQRAAGRTGAFGHVAAAAGIWAGVLLTGAVGALGAGALVTVDGRSAQVDAAVVVTYGVAWLVGTAAESAVAYRLGRFYHPTWSALARLQQLGRRAPEGWARLRQTGNRLRSSLPPALLAVLCCLGCCFLGPLLNLAGGGWALATLAAAGGHLGWTGVRLARFGRLHTNRRRTLLGDISEGGHQ